MRAERYSMNWSDGHNEGLDTDDNRLKLARFLVDKMTYLELFQYAVDAKCMEYEKTPYQFDIDIGGNESILDQS